MGGNALPPAARRHVRLLGVRENRRPAGHVPQARSLCAGNRADVYRQRPHGALRSRLHWRVRVRAGHLHSARHTPQTHHAHHAPLHGGDDCADGLDLSEKSRARLRLLRRGTGADQRADAGKEHRAASVQPLPDALPALSAPPHFGAQPMGHLNLCVGVRSGRVLRLVSQLARLGIYALHSGGRLARSGGRHDEDRRRRHLAARQLLSQHA